MIDAGIDNPESQEGIDFCLECPYPECVVGKGSGYEKRIRRQSKAVSMLKSGISTSDIASSLGISVRQVERYTKGHYSGHLA
jgi:hypothetical protein